MTPGTMLYFEDASQRLVPALRSPPCLAPFVKRSAELQEFATGDGVAEALSRVRVRRLSLPDTISRQGIRVLAARPSAPKGTARMPSVGELSDPCFSAMPWLVLWVLQP